MGKVSGSPFPPVRPRFPEVLCSLTAASPTGDQGSHVCGSERPWLESLQRSLVSQKDGGAAGGAVGTKEAGHSFLAPVPDEKQLGGERVRWFVCFPHNSRSQFIIAGMSRQELEAAGHLPSTVSLGNENVKVAHTLNACACYQLTGESTRQAPPPSPRSVSARTLEALEFTALGLTRWDQGGLLKVLLASSLAGVASESYLILPLTPRDSGSQRDDPQEQPTRVDEERSVCFLFFAPLSG